MSAKTLLFPFGMRLTTWAMVAVFVTLAVRHRDWRPLAAGWAWLLGFEAAFDISRALSGYGYQTSRVLPIIVGVFTVVWFWREGIRPDRRWLIATAAVWIIWLAYGFPVNYHTLEGFKWAPEILNVTAKTLLAVAYLVPFLAHDAAPEPFGDGVRA